MIISKKNIVNYVVLSVLILFGLYTRYWDLLLKPIHFDESINGWFIDQIFKNGFFKYDPSNYHGPLFFYLQFSLQKVAGFGLWNLRFFTTTFSYLVILLFAFHKNRKANILAILFALSSSAVFYGRSGIHESFFVFLSLAAWWCIVEESDSLGIGICCLILATAVKETWALQVFAAIFATLFSGMWSELYKKFVAAFNSASHIRHRAWVLVGLFVWILSFSGGFKNPHGLLDFFIAYFPWAKTGVQGSGHDKVWWYWLELIFKNDSIVFSAILSSLMFFAFKFSARSKWILIFALINFIAYSVIPYKTPWCVISITWPFMWLAASVVSELFDFVPSQKNEFRLRSAKILSAVVLVCTSILSFRSMFDSSLREPINLRHPFVYVNGTESMRQFHLALIKSGLIDRSDLKAQVAIKEYWPFPWLLRTWGLNLSGINNGVDVSAVIFAVDLADAELLESKFLGKYWKMKFATRQDIAESLFYVRADIAEPFLKINGEWVTRLNESK